MALTVTTLPSNISIYLSHDFNHLRITSNDYLNVSYMAERAFKILFAELDLIKTNWMIFVDSDWAEYSELESGEKINTKWFKINISKIFSNQKLIVENLELVDSITGELPFTTDEYVNSPDSPLRLNADEFVDSDIINRPIYRLWKNNKQILAWLENYKNFGYFD